MRRAEVDRVTLAMAEQSGAAFTEEGRAKDMLATLDVLTDALGDTAKERDAMYADAAAARDETAELALDMRLMEERNDAIFDQLEDAVTVSMEPLDKMFRSVGLSPETMLDQVRQRLFGPGRPAGAPISLSTKGAGADTSPEETARERDSQRPRHR